MILTLMILLINGLASVSSRPEPSPGIAYQDSIGKIAELLEQLAPGFINEGGGVLTVGPSWEVIARSEQELIRIANESPQSRVHVITALTEILDEPDAEHDIIKASRWRIALQLLGELRAVEAIPNLAANLHRRHYLGSPERKPPVRRALVCIGRPAVMLLLQSLSHQNKFIRTEAAEALGEIGISTVDGLREILTRGAAPARAAAVIGLSRIDHKVARDAIRMALRTETDKEVVEELDYAVEYTNHVQRLKHPKGRLQQ